MVVDIIWREVATFFDATLWVGMIQSNDYSYLRTPVGLLSALRPFIPVLLLIEVVRALVSGTFKSPQFRVIAAIYIVNRAFATWIVLGAAAFAIALFAPLAPFSLGITWWSVIYAYLVYELSHFVFHFTAHKVRLLWCLHSTHHSPETMNLMVSYCHFFFQGLYSGFVRVGICTLLGVSPPLFAIVFACDRLWGAFVHVSEDTLKDGRLGWLESWILTPSHHRVHHARNPAYVDTNFCNLLNIWDRIFGTYQKELREVPIEYGLNRSVNAGSFFDVYFGEIVLLARDVWRAPGLKNKLLYLIMPPGWSHTGQHHTAMALRRAYFQKRAAPATAA